MSGLLFAGCCLLCVVRCLLCVVSCLLIGACRALCGDVAPYSVDALVFVVCRLLCGVFMCCVYFCWLSAVVPRVLLGGCSSLRVWWPFACSLLCC